MHKGDFYFLDLPVYRLPEEEYNKQRSTFIESEMKKYRIHITPSSLVTAKDLQVADDNNRDRLWKSFGGAWRYNEIIGYVRLYLFFTQIRGQYWRVMAKRIVRNGKKNMGHWEDKLAPLTELPTSGSNKEIYDAILEHVNDCRKKLKKPKRYLDAERLTTIGSFVDWRALFKWD